MIICVNLHNSNQFSGNPLLEQHKLRYQSIIDRQGWEVPHYRHLEYDQYDNPAAKYLIWRDESGKVGGVSRLYPTDRPYMLKDVFSYLAPNTLLPCNPHILEGSRFCVDKSLPVEVRQRVCRELIISYLEYGLKNQIEEFIGVMLPIYWRNLFTGIGWNVDFYGEAVALENGQKIRAGRVIVSEKVLELVRMKTGIHESVLINPEDTPDIIDNFVKKAA